RIPDACTIAVVTAPPREARQHPRRGARSADDPGSYTSRDDISLAAPEPLALRRLANLLLRYAPHDGVFPLRLPGTYALRRSRMTSEAVHATLGPSLWLVAQGAKVVMLGREVFESDPARMLVFAVDLPVSGQVTRASWREPFLGVKLDLDPTHV